MKHRIGAALIAVVMLCAAGGSAWAAAVLGDVTFVRKTTGEEDFPPATFSHWNHRVKFKCYVCHNKKVGFEMKAGASVNVSMASIDEGRHCGACHRGQPAFGVGFETCTRCHRK